MTFKCTLEEFKQKVAEFCKEAEKVESLEQLDAGFKCLSHYFLGIESEEGMEEAEGAVARSYLNYATRRMFYKEISLL